MVLLTSETGAASVTHGDTVFAPLDGTDAVFELPPELAEHLLALGGWRYPELDELPVDEQVDDTETPDVDDQVAAVDEPAPAPKRRRAPRKTTPAS